MRRTSSLLLATAAFAAVGLVGFRAVLLGGEQFGYRDASHHYYPLELRVCQEWRAGRVPLWDPWENGGQPLLGNPTAAVLYPGKLLYALMPFDRAFRAYVVAHVALAFAGLAILLRGWGVGAVGSILGGLSYAFGAPVLFQCSNVIYLVGAAWLPFGLRAADAWLRSGTRRGLAALAVVLALQALGGDPEAAYLTVVASAGYALILHRPEESGGRAARTATARRLRAGLAVGGLLAVAVATAAILPTIRAWVGSLPGGSSTGRALGAGLVVAAAVWGLVRARRSRPRLVGGLLGLAAASALGLALAAAQVLPIAEFARQSARGSDHGSLDLYGFSLLPYRLVELIWPNVSGLAFPTNRAWVRTLPPANDHTFWTPSLYLGGLTLVLACGAFGSGRERPWRAWLGWVVALSLLGSFGRFAGPIGATRWLPPLSALAPTPEGPTRAHDEYRDGDGSPYWFLASLLPGFGAFRYPSKLLTFTNLGLSALAGIGWERVRSGRGAGPARLAGLLALLSGLALAAVLVGRGPILAAWSARPAASPEAGPLDAPGAFALLTAALIQGGLVFAAGFGIIRLAAVRRDVAGGLAVAITALDLAVANAPLVWTVPQAVYDREPRALAVIREAERREPAGGPFRVHRMPVWHPFALFRAGSPDRLAEIVAWERDTLQPLHGLPLGVEYTLTLGVLEDDRYLRQFLPMSRPLGPELGARLGVPGDEPVLYYPRRAFDLWNTRYVLLPTEALDWRQESRALAAFLDQVDLLAPDLADLDDPGRRAAWKVSEDWQVFRNRAAFPRAWIVHEARVVRPFEELTEPEQSARIRTLTYQADPLWNEPGRPVLDLRRAALIESADPRSTRLDLRAPPLDSEAAESVSVVSYTPLRVELEARLDAAGLVVLADVDAPGWSLSLDGRPAPILRANHAMRAAAVPAGRHRLVYRYDPASFRVGRVVSIAALALLAGLLALPVRRARPARFP